MTHEEVQQCVTVSTLTVRNILCVGPWYLQHAKNERNWDTGQNEKVSLGESPRNGTTQDEQEEEDEADDLAFLRKLDPKEWKTQDHYAVLGLRKLRHMATEDDIKKAYRDKVRRHHPDKRKARGEEILPDDDYFTCITKAWETLGVTKSRRAYDSVDPTFDNSIPANNEQVKRRFFETFAPVFQRNERWSTKKPVPRLGDADSPREDVDKFYSFWYNFTSWREYSYLDEEEKEKGQGREERRWIDRQNKAAREKLKKEEMARIRQLTDTAYALDPRIQRFKTEEKERKLAAKQAKKDAAKARKEEEERKARAAEEEARRKKEEEEAEEKAKRNAIKAEKEAQRRELKSRRTQLRRLAKANAYYTQSDGELVHHMAALEKMCEILEANQLEKLTKRLEAEGRAAFLSSLHDVERRIEEEKKSSIGFLQRNSSTPATTAAAVVAATATPSTAATGCVSSSNDEDVSSQQQKVATSGRRQWGHDELQLLIKAVNVFPPGTNRRWEVVANFINQHRPTGEVGIYSRTAKEVLSKAKDLQNSDYTKNVLKVNANLHAFNNCCERNKVVLPDPGTTTEAATTEDSVEEMKKDNQASPTKEADEGGGGGPWTASEQLLLEQALKTFPAYTEERWDKIAACVASRSKRQCMRRYKELVELVKAKKKAAAAANK